MYIGLYPIEKKSRAMGGGVRIPMTLCAPLGSTPTPPSGLSQNLPYTESNEEFCRLQGSGVTNNPNRCMEGGTILRGQSLNGAKYVPLVKLGAQNLIFQGGSNRLHYATASRLLPNE
ncbi:hypothetical protein TNCV_2422291 [Trichonephila clavipes]|nr:hypothetical protein TNCV_2422291 [Trichonephila clavipes]